MRFKKIKEALETIDQIKQTELYTIKPIKMMFAKINLLRCDKQDLNSGEFLKDKFNILFKKKATISHIFVEKTHVESCDITRIRLHKYYYNSMILPIELFEYEEEELKHAKEIIEFFDSHQNYKKNVQNIEICIV